MPLKLSEVAQPDTAQATAAVLAQAAAEGRSVRIVGGGTKQGWGALAPEPALTLQTGSLHRILEHNVGDLTAVLEAGVPLARAQARFAETGQMLALDPPLGERHAATIGGVIASADSGPLRHRYGGPRDLVIGITVALPDGTLARAGGNVIKNVAGYDLAKLFTGSFGTLGAIVSVNVRLHPRPQTTATTLGASADPAVLASAAQALQAAPLEFEALDVGWRGRWGELLARTGGARPEPRARRAAALMREQGLERIDVSGEDAELWARQREGQRSRGRALVRLATKPSALADVLRVAQACGAALVGRAALGTSYLELDPDAVAPLRERLPDARAAVVLDGPAWLRQAQDPWGSREGPALELMRRIKRSFDSAGICNPGAFVGGI
jgi:glycolate oxidase FAD binding subunit